LAQESVQVLTCCRSSFKLSIAFKSFQGLTTCKYCGRGLAHFSAIKKGPWLLGKPWQGASGSWRALSRAPLVRRRRLVHHERQHPRCPGHCARRPHRALAIGLRGCPLVRLLHVCLSRPGTRGPNTDWVSYRRCLCDLLVHWSFRRHILHLRYCQFRPLLPLHFSPIHLHFFFCAQDDGTPVGDYPYCASSAFQMCTSDSRRRRNAFPRSPHPPQPGARSEKPDSMKTRAQLGRIKHHRDARPLCRSSIFLQLCALAYGHTGLQ
jgi:hypothetical protein